MWQETIPGEGEVQADDPLRWPLKVEAQSPRGDGQRLGRRRSQYAWKSNTVHSAVSVLLPLKVSSEGFHTDTFQTAGNQPNSPKVQTDSRRRSVCFCVFMQLWTVWWQFVRILVSTKELSFQFDFFFSCFSTEMSSQHLCFSEHYLDVSALVSNCTGNQAFLLWNAEHLFHLELEGSLLESIQRPDFGTLLKTTFVPIPWLSFHNDCGEHEELNREDEEEALCYSQSLCSLFWFIL